jgi:hypothetical protein
MGGGHISAWSIDQIPGEDNASGYSLAFSNTLSSFLVSLLKITTSLR